MGFLNDLQNIQIAWEFCLRFFNCFKLCAGRELSFNETQFTVLFCVCKMINSLVPDQIYPFNNHITKELPPRLISFNVNDNNYSVFQIIVSFRVYCFRKFPYSRFSICITVNIHTFETILSHTNGHLFIQQNRTSYNVCRIYIFFIFLVEITLDSTTTADF